MHILQPKHIKLKQSDVQELIKKHNISLAQLPKIKSDDPSIPEGCFQGDVVKIERKDDSGATVYYRVVA